MPIIVSYLDVYKLQLAVGASAKADRVVHADLLACFVMLCVPFLNSIIFFLKKRKTLFLESHHTGFECCSFFKNFHRGLLFHFVFFIANILQNV